MRMESKENTTKITPTIFDFFKELKKIKAKQARELLIIEEIIIQQSISTIQQ